VLLDALEWSAARRAVDAVRYQPRQLALVMARAGSQAAMRPPVARWLAETRKLPAVVKAASVPQSAVRIVAAEATRWFGPTASALVRWFSAAVAAAADRFGAVAMQQVLSDRAHPGMLVPHPHAVAVLALDMRGFSHLTRVLQDSQYLADLIGEYLSALTHVVERHRGVVFQYTGDGLLALFLPELAGANDAKMLDQLTRAMSPELHQAFDATYERWQSEWRVRGREGAEIGLGAGLSFGCATIGFMGPAGKKQFGVIGEPVNTAAFLCSQAHPGTVLIDCDSFVRAGGVPPLAKVIRLRSKKRHQRIETFSLRYGTQGIHRRRAWLPGVATFPGL
jgi:class 3 adenylate cyclase